MPQLPQIVLKCPAQPPYNEVSPLATTAGNHRKGCTLFSLFIGDAIIRLNKMSLLLTLFHSP